MCEFVLHHFTIEFVSTKGPYFKHVGEVTRSFCRTMKYFWHTLTGHEIFVQIFDGPQKLFLCAFFLIFVSNFF